MKKWTRDEQNEFMAKRRYLIIQSGMHTINEQINTAMNTINEQMN